MIKRALIVGINYLGTSHALRGCLNDAHNMHDLLTSKGFEIELCLEKDATTKGIKDALLRLIAGVQPGDVIVFHYSGHGSQLPSSVEADGWEEIICPIDLDWVNNVITDDTLRAIFNQVPNGVNTTVILDCCHSGSGLDQDMSYTSEVVTIPVVQDAAEKRFLRPPPDIMERLKDRKEVAWSTSRDVNASALLIAGCQSNQTSADAFIDGQAQGAATAALIKSVKANPLITYRKLLDEMTEFMVVNQYTQRPELDGYPGLFDLGFLRPLVGLQAPPTTPTVPIVEQVPQVAGKKDHSTITAIAVIVAVLVAFAILH